MNAADRMDAEIRSSSWWTEDTVPTSHWARCRERLKAAYLRLVRGRRLEAPGAFIVGCGHSGTSLLLAMLAAHPRIFAIPQESWLAFLERPGRLLRRFDAMALCNGKARWVEKTPRHIHRLDKLRRLQPGAKFLLILRDGRDVACSLQERRNRDSSLEDGARRWVEDNRAGRSFWNAPDVHVLRYEDLIQSPEATLTAALEFLGEAYDPACLEYHRQNNRFYSNDLNRPESPAGADHDQYRNWQINQPIFDGRRRWLRLSQEEKRVVEQIAGEMLRELGYTEDSSW